MAISKEKNEMALSQYERHEGDTGSVEVNVAVLLVKQPPERTHQTTQKDHATYRGFDEENRSPS